MAASQLGANSDKMEGRNEQTYSLFSYEEEDLQPEVEDLQLEVEDLQLEAEDLQLEAKGVQEDYHLAETRLETLTHRRKHGSTCRLKCYLA